MLYKFEIQINDNDYYEFNRYHITESADNKKGMLFYRLYVPLIFICMFILFALGNQSPFMLIFLAVFYGIISLIWALATKSILSYSIKRRIKKMKKKGDMLYTESAEMEFYEEGFTETTKNAKSEIKYDAVYKVKVNEGKAVYIYQNSVQAFIVPFSAFKSDEERKEFIAFISEKAK